MGKWIIIGLSVIFLTVIVIIMLKFRGAVKSNDDKVKNAAPMLVLSVVCFAFIVVALTTVLLIFVAGR